MGVLRVLFDCDNCPSFCCSYAHTALTPADLRRLARRFSLDEETAKRRFTKQSLGETVLRHTPDEHYGTACRFLDRQTRGCSVYAARPRICRSYPGSGRCGYYDFLMSERNIQQDPQWVARAYNP